MQGPFKIKKSEFLVWGKSNPYKASEMILLCSKD